MNRVDRWRAILRGANRHRWQFGFNDPNFAGWAATAGYVVAGALAFSAAARAPAGSFDRRFWWLVCAVMLALAVNKQLDLQVLLMDYGRAWSANHGWYEQRRTFQRSFMIVLGGTAAVIAAASYFAVRSRGPTIRLALVGLVATAGYVLVRAAAFNHADSWLPNEIAGVRWDWMVELAATGVIAFAAWRFPAERH